MNKVRELHIDYETRSECDLVEAGVHVYANHPSTDIICMAYAFDDEEVKLWIPEMGPCPADVVSHIESGGLVVCQNVMFEFQITNVVGEFYGFPKLKPEQIKCTMIQSYMMGMPGKLEKSVPAFGIEDEKDMKGNRVMMQLSQPKRRPD
jgi:DNA polymerase